MSEENQTKQEKIKKNNKLKTIGRIIVYGSMLVFLLFWIYNLKRSKIAANEGATAGSLKTLNGMFATYRKKGYSYTGKRYPHALPNADGKGSTNAGKYSGLYREINSAGQFVNLIGAGEMAADFRADGDTDMREDNGFYIISTNIDGIPTFFKPDYFSCKPKQGYWYGLMNYYNSNGNKIPYDIDYARKHYALVAIPADYGSSGEHTFIINEEGTVYKKDLGKAEYIDTYPGPDPIKHGWEVAE